jgi:hypothetical protein
MWKVERDLAGHHGSLGLRFFEGDRCLSFAELLAGLLEQSQFREIFRREMSAAPFVAFRWETPPLTRGNLHQTFQCLLHDSPDLDVPQDPRDFSPHFRQDTDVVSFENLGADAVLVVPCPISDSGNYSHIAAFHRSAPGEQQHAFWQAVASTVLQRLGNEPLWLSTAGGGVDWLHVRLDSRPKYYRYAPWRKL